MADYPDIGRRHTIEPLVPSRVDVSDSGAVRKVDLNESTTYRITVTHPLITAAELATLRTFYAANRATANTITIDGTDYTVLFEGDYSWVQINANYRDASVTLIGTEA